MQEFSGYINTLIVFIVGALIGGFLISYFRRKGENVATKEDVGEITKIVESVKTDIQSQISTRQRRFDTREAHLLKFYDLATDMLHGVLSVRLENLPYDAGKSLYETQKRANEIASELAKAYQRLVLYLPADSQMLRDAEQLSNAATGVAQSFSQDLAKFKVAIMEEGHAMQSDDRDWKETAVQSTKPKCSVIDLIHC